MSSTLQDNVCLALLSGIPAAGKTTLSNLFCEFVNTIPFDLNVCDQKGRLRVLHIVYDKLIPEDLDFAQVCTIALSLFTPLANFIIGGVNRLFI